MKYPDKTIIYLIIFFWQIISCNTKEPRQILYSKRDIQIDTNAVLTLNEPFIYDTSKSNLTKISNLLDLRNNKSLLKGEEIRIWFEYSLSDSGKVIILKNEKEKWSSIACFYKYIVDKHNYIISIRKKIVENKPRSGWSAFLKELMNLGIYKLKNFDQIRGYRICTDPDQLTIEIFKNGSYYRYDYPCYDLYMEEAGIEDMNGIKQICNLIQKEFGYKLFPRPD